MIPRALLLAVLVLTASCVPRATARDAQVTPEAAAASVDAFRALPAARVPEVIDAVTAPGSAAAPFLAGASGNGLDCLTAAVYYEARSETEDGQRAVAQVVLNRVRHPAFPRSICGVVFQGRERRTGCQFSFSCDGSMNRSREPGAWERARQVAEAALTGYVYVPVGLATHFHTTAIHPWWASSMRRAVTVGAHVFYRWPGAWGDPLAFRQAYQGFEGGVPSGGPDVAEMPRATETVMGVTVHRGSAGRDATPAERRAPRVEYARSETGSVRIYRGSGAGGGRSTVPGVRVHSGASAVEVAESAPIVSDEAGVPAR